MRDENPIEDTKYFLGDLWRETSWVVRVGLFTGMAAGVLAGFYFAGILSADVLLLEGSSRRGPRLGIAFFLLLLLGCTAAGGFSGLVAGVVVELIRDALLGKPDEGAKNRPKRKRRRR